MRHGIIEGLLLLTLVAVSGCESPLYEEIDHTFQGEPMVAFAPTLPDGSYSMELTFAAGSQASEQVSLQVQYVGEAPQTAVTGSFTVSSDGAVEGEHFTLPGGEAFTIDAGQNATRVPVDLLGSGLGEGESVTLTFQLADGSGYAASGNYGTFEIIMAKDGG